GGGQVHRVLGVGVQGDPVEALVEAGHAVGGDDSGRRAQAFEDVLEEVGLGEGLLGVASAGVPGPAAVVVLAPGDGVVLAHRVRAGVVAVLVERGEHVHVTTRVVLEGVPLVVAVPLGRQVTGGGVC